MMQEFDVNLLPLCPDEGELSAYNQGLLPQAEMLQIASHVEQCRRCLDTLKLIDDRTDALIDDLRYFARSEWRYGEDNNPHLRRQIESICAWSGSSSVVPKSTTNSTFDDMLLCAGPYEMLEPLGRGGMGRVYKAQHRFLGQLAAVKLLPREYRDNPVALRRFQQEMKAIGRLQHPHIVQALDANIEDVPYLAMEFIEGMDLGRLIEQHGPLLVAHACECTRQAALALQYLCESGVVHRDIKPSNLMLTPEGVVKLVDLGLAHLGDDELPPMSDTVTDCQLTRHDEIMGTMDYVAPEQLLDSRAVDIRADLYSLGCTLYHLLTGKPVFANSPAPQTGKPQAHLLQPIPDLRQQRPDLPEGLVEIVEQLLAKKPEQRFSSPAALMLALHPFTQGTSLAGLLETLPAAGRPTGRSRKLAGEKRDVAASPPSRTRRGKPPAQSALPKHRWPMLVYIVLGLLLTVSVFFFLKMDPALFQPNSTTPGDGTAPALIENMYINHFRGQGPATQWLGRIDMPAAAVEQGDSVRLQAHFREPVWCYLILFHPNGRDQLCYPRHAQEAQTAKTNLTFPAREAFTLNSKPGMYTFVLIASKKPLPDYDTFKASVDTPWPKPQIPPDGIRIFDGRKDRHIPLPSMVAGNAVHSNLFGEMCRLLKEQPEVESLYSIAFPVQPRKPPPARP